MSDQPVTAGPQGPVLLTVAWIRAAIYWSGVGVFSLTLGLLFAGLFVNVLLRYLFAEGISWAYEIPYILFPWTVGGAIVVAACLGRNIRVALLVTLAGKPLRRGIAIAVHGMTATIALGVLWSSLPILNASKFMRLAETGIPQFYGMLGLVFAFAAVAAVSLIDGARLLFGGENPEETPSESSLS